jgi:hypothetical protein
LPKAFEFVGKHAAFLCRLSIIEHLEPEIDEAPMTGSETSLAG